MMLNNYIQSYCHTFPVAWQLNAPTTFFVIVSWLISSTAGAPGLQSFDLENQPSATVGCPSPTAPFQPFLSC